MVHLTSVIGREKEKAILLQCLENAVKSRGQAVMISGEAGIGKTTLVRFLQSEAEARGFAILAGESFSQDGAVPYLPFQRAFKTTGDKDFFQTEEFARFDEIFLISKIGLLISHVSRMKGEGMDEDILGSMLTAVQDFVKDSFGDGNEVAQKGGLGKLEYMNTKITIEHGDTAYLAVVSSGEEHPEMRSDIKRCLADVENQYFDILADWNGDVDSLADSKYILKKLVERKYRVKRSLENINIKSERLKMQNRIYDFIDARSEDRGLLLVLEDLHWADESTLLSIPFIVRNILNKKIILCLTYRSEETSPAIVALTDQLNKESTLQIIELENLSDSSVLELITCMLDGKTPPDELIDNLKRETQGNPFFITEVVRAMVSEGTLYRDGDVWVMKHSGKSSVPQTVVELVSRRLETLDLDSLRILEYGAILGRRFSIELLSSGYSLEYSHLRKLIDQLASQNLVNIVESNEVMFQHSKTQEIIYSEMSERWKRVSHKNAGMTYERIYSGKEEEVLYNLAYHFSRTLDFDKGIDYCVSAGYKASNNFAPREACKFFEKAIDLIELSGRKDERYLEVNQMVGELFELDGNYGKAISIFDKVLSGTDDKYLSSNVLMAKGRVLQSQGKYQDAIAVYEQGILLAEESGSTLLKAKINGYLGKIYLRKGEHDKALEMQRIFLNESKAASEGRDIGQAYMNLGGVYWHMNDQQMAIRHWEDALKIFEELKYLQGIANVHDNLGVGYSTIGQFDKSLEHYKASEEIMAKIGDVRGMSMVLLNIGVLYNRIGTYQEALKYNMKSLQIKKKIGDIVGAANIFNNIGGNYVDLERYGEALDYFTQNYTLMEKSGDTWGIARSLNNIAESEIALERFDSASEHCERSLELGIKHSLNDIQSYSYLLKGVIASHDENFTMADQYFEKGLELGIKTEDPFRIGMAHLFIARSMEGRGEKEKAIDHYSIAIKTFDKSGMETCSKKARKELQGAIERSVAETEFSKTI
jgi:predicted ATPase